MLLKRFLVIFGSLTNYGFKDNAKKQLMASIVSILRRNSANDLIVIPLLKTVDTLISNACLDTLVENDSNSWVQHLFLLLAIQIKYSNIIWWIISETHSWNNYSDLMSM